MSRDEFLAGERLDDVALYLSDDAVDDPGALADRGERVEDGVVLVVDGERGRSAFSAATGTDAMGFAKTAMDRDGEIHRDLTGGGCPEDDGEGSHAVRFLLAFAEEQNEDVGGIYAEGNVIHAYAQCSCGVAYSEKWVADGS